MAVNSNADFSGWATKNDLRCADGLTIKRDAFKHNDGAKVPLVWQHQHGGAENVLGHAILENREEGVYAYGFFNETPAGVHAKTMVQHGDVDSLSIYANGLKKRGQDVIHGAIREVSIVLAGANPGALIDTVRLVHGDGDFEDLEDEAVISTGLYLEHAAGSDNKGDEVSKDKTLAEVFNSLSDEQKDLVTGLVGMALEENSTAQHSEENDEDDTLEHSDEVNNEDGDSIQHSKGDSNVSRNVFDTNTDQVKLANGGTTLTHGQLLDYAADVAGEVKKGGTFREAMLAHAETYGITNIEELFPDAKNIDNMPEWITRKMEWVDGVLNGVAKRPFSRIKSRSADLTHEEARAKGYVKGSMKKEQFFAIAHRVTTATTIYKKQKLDRDDIIDITDFDVVAWIWVEMRFMLNEEIARAILLGDGREVDDEDKISETNIRPIAHDEEFYTDVLTIAPNVTGDGIVEAVLRGRPRYKGSQPTAYMDENLLTDLLLVKDKLGRRLYETEAALAAALRVRNIVSVPILEGAQHNQGIIQMILVNLGDYVVGTDKGGEISRFDDFDIDFNQYKYLIEGRMSGALVKHKTAQVLVRTSGTSVTPEVPTFNATTGVVTIPNTTGVTYYKVVVDGDDVALTAGAQTAIASGATIDIVAVPNTGYYFPHNFDADWTFKRN